MCYKQNSKRKSRSSRRKTQDSLPSQILSDYSPNCKLTVQQYHGGGEKQIITCIKYKKRESRQSTSSTWLIKSEKTYNPIYETELDLSQSKQRNSDGYQRSKQKRPIHTNNITGRQHFHLYLYLQVSLR